MHVDGYETWCEAIYPLINPLEYINPDGTFRPIDDMEWLNYERKCNGMIQYAFALHINLIRTRLLPLDADYATHEDITKVCYWLMELPQVERIDLLSSSRLKTEKWHFHVGLCEPMNIIPFLEGVATSCTSLKLCGGFARVSLQKKHAVLRISDKKGQITLDDTQPRWEYAIIREKGKWVITNKFHFPIISDGYNNTPKQNKVLNLR